MPLAERKHANLSVIYSVSIYQVPADLQSLSLYQCFPQSVTCTINLKLRERGVRARAAETEWETE